MKFSQRTPIAIFLIVGLVAISMFSFYSYGTNSVSNKATFFSDIMIKKSNREYLYKWDTFPIYLRIYDRKSAGHRPLLDSVLAELDSIAEKKLFKSDLAARNDPQVHLIFSPKYHLEFEEVYENYFIEQFGIEEHKTWLERGGFQFPYKKEHPCFTVIIPNSNVYFSEKYRGKRRPDTAFITIGNSAHISKSELIGCLREELAHAAFFIPDWEVEDPDETIFNANQISGATESFSSLDTELMKILINPKLKNGMTFNEMQLTVAHILNEKHEN